MGILGNISRRGLGDLGGIETSGTYDRSRMNWFERAMVDLSSKMNTSNSSTKHATESIINSNYEHVAKNQPSIPSPPTSWSNLKIDRKA